MTILPPESGPTPTRSPNDLNDEGIALSGHPLGRHHEEKLSNNQHTAKSLPAPVPSPVPCPGLLIDDLSMAYGDHLALHAISFSIQPGEVVGVLGRNGAGKSSLVKAICGRHPIRSGAILINGQAVGARAARQHLGVAPQRSALYPYLTARENLICFARQMGLSKSDACIRADEILITTEMIDHADKRTDFLSGGMRQRINIGAAIVHNPRLVILDEPSAGLDPTGQTHINHLIKTLKEAGYAVMLITHDMLPAQDLCDQIVILQSGTIAAAGVPDDLIHDICGERINLYLSASANISARDHGFVTCTHKPGQWNKQVVRRSQLAGEINTLVTAGLDLHHLTIVPANLGDVLAELSDVNCAQDQVGTASQPIGQ